MIKWIWPKSFVFLGVKQIYGISISSYFFFYNLITFSWLILLVSDLSISLLWIYSHSIFLEIMYFLHFVNLLESQVGGGVV